MNDLEPPKIQFPCPNYPIKVVGDGSEFLRAFVEAVMAKFDPSFDPAKVHTRLSRNGRYLAVNVVITAVNVDQLSAIFEELKTNPAVRIVL